ncbi:MAG: ABC transporter permease [Jatrophihabitans sp.]
MLRVELTTQLWRIRTMIALACLAAVPVVAGLATASHAGHRNGTQGGLFGAGTFSALNHTVASLDFIAPLLLPLTVALLASAIGSADREWGTLRYLYVQPVSRSRLLTGKLGAVLIVTATATGCVLLGGLCIGLVLFGWHPFHIIGSANLATREALARILAASGYTLLCMLSIAAIAFALGLLLPRGAEALGISVAFVIVASILDGQSNLHALAAVLPMHYWQNWTQLFETGGAAHLGGGVIDQVATIVIAIGVSILVLLRRDPAA